MSQSQIIQVFKLLTLGFCLSAGSSSARDFLHKVQELPSRAWTSKRVVRIAQIAANLDKDLPPPRCGVKAYRITYQTQNARDEARQASGLLEVPTCVQKSYPLLNYNHSTRLLKNDAPSTNKYDVEATAIASLFAGYGFIVALPDYLGLGQSVATQEYMSRKSNGRMIRDFLLAVQEFLAEEKIQLDGRLFIAGYSQGAFAALAVLQNLEENPLIGLKPVATAALAGIYNLEELSLDFTIQKGDEADGVFALMVLLSQSRSHPDFPQLDEILKAPYIAVAEKILDGKLEFRDAMKLLPSKAAELFLPDFLKDLEQDGKNHRLAQALSAQSVDRRKFQTPLFLYVSKKDQETAVRGAELSYARLQKQGVQVDLLVDPSAGDHIDASLPSLLETRRYFTRMDASLLDILGPTFAPLNK
jgi:pimeloyl-ACP methyl ester carboxylesterase